MICTPREGNPGNVLLTMRNPPKYFYQCAYIANVLIGNLTKGGLISESFSLWFKSPKKMCQIKHKNKVGYLIFWNLLLFFQASKSHSFTLQPPSTLRPKEATWWRSEILRLEFKKSNIQLCFLCIMVIIGLFQCGPWCLPTQNWLQVATTDISILHCKPIPCNDYRDLPV